MHFFRILVKNIKFFLFSWKTLVFFCWWRCYLLPQDAQQLHVNVVDAGNCGGVLRCAHCPIYLVIDLHWVYTTLQYSSLCSWLRTHSSCWHQASLKASSENSKGMFSTVVLPLLSKTKRAFPYVRSKVVLLSNDRLVGFGRKFESFLYIRLRSVQLKIKLTI